MPFRLHARVAGHGSCRGRMWVLGLLLLWWPGRWAFGMEPQIATTAREVHSMPREEAEEGIPVHLLATVTYYQPEERNLFIEDETGGVFVDVLGLARLPLRVGDRVEVDGVTRSSFRTVVAPGSRIRVLGPGGKVRATPASYGQLVSGEMDCRKVSIRGQVRSATLEQHEAGTVAQLQVLAPGGSMQVYVQHYSGLDLPSLIDAQVELTGVAGADFNRTLQLMRPKLYVDGAWDVRVLRGAPVAPLALPMTDIERVMESRFMLDGSSRVRVRGAVTEWEPGNSLVIQAGGHGVLALTRQTGMLTLGSVVDVVGFADGHAYSAVLEDAQFFPTGRVERIVPQAVTYAEAMQGTYSDALVAVRGRVLSEMQGEESDALEVEVDRHAVRAVLPRNGRAALPDLQMGTLVSLTGICRVTPTPWGRPMLFRLDLRDVGDVRVLARPSWWTARHTMQMGSALLAVTSVVLCWVAVLRRRVAQQTGQIEQAIRVERERSRLLECINSKMPLEDLLEEICRSIGLLVPEASCSYVLGNDENGGELLYQAELSDGLGRRVGVFRVTSAGTSALSAEQRKTLALGASLANLAVNQRQLYDELNYQSTHDQLTTLPNRRLADTHLEEALTAGSRVGVAYIDIDRFKEVNDKHGHKVGDLYLQQIAGRLHRAVRGSDLLARIGGDEFLLVASTLGSMEDGEAYQRRLLGCFADDFMLDGVRVRGSASVGMAMFPDHGTTPEELKRYADAAMYAVKHGKRDGVAPEAESWSAAQLQEALDARRFRLHYQPQFSSEGKLRGLEALLRLEDPVLGMVPPNAFIRVAEQSDVVFPLGRWVLHEALAAAVRWKFGKEDEVRMVVNVCARQMEKTGFAEEVRAALAEFGLRAEVLELELTERTAVSEAAGEQLQALRRMGVQLSIDDFGVEHSSLSMLHRLPVDTLKIDRSFVRAMASEPEVLPIVEAIVQMGRALGKRIVAEGVEHPGDLQALERLGEMDYQGFLFSRPVPPEVVWERLESWRRVGGVVEVLTKGFAGSAEQGYAGVLRAAAPALDRV